MSVIALNEGYQGEVKDREENFHGNRLLFVGWEDHLMFCSPHCVLVPSTMTFATFVDEVLPGIYASHPDWGKAGLAEIEWFRSGERFTPEFARTLGENGLLHKAVLRFRTPGLTGIDGSCS
jgi:phenol hydroxylase P4 protein